MNNKPKQYPKGHFLGLWMGIMMAVFSGIIIPFSIITDNTAFIGLGPALGVAAGVAIGSGNEQKKEKEGRQDSDRGKISSLKGIKPRSVLIDEIS